MRKAIREMMADFSFLFDYSNDCNLTTFLQGQQELFQKCRLHEAKKLKWLRAANFQTVSNRKTPVLGIPNGGYACILSKTARLQLRAFH
jgi:hypothetical protein